MLAFSISLRVFLFPLVEIFSFIREEILDESFSFRLVLESSTLSFLLAVFVFLLLGFNLIVELSSNMPVLKLSFKLLFDTESSLEEKFINEQFSS